MTYQDGRGSDVMEVMCRRRSAQLMRGLGTDCRSDRKRIVVAVARMGFGEHMEVASRRSGVTIVGTSKQEVNGRLELGLN